MREREREREREIEKNELKFVKSYKKTLVYFADFAEAD